MKNKQKRTKKSYLYIIFLALAFIILLGTGAYAYYQTTISGTITGTVARWSFTANNQTSTFNIDFGSLYPGKTGTYNLELSAGNSDLPVYFEVIYHYPDQTTTTGQLKTHALFKPLCFPGYSESISNTDCHINNFTIANDYNAYMVGYKGMIMPGTTATVPIGYNWPYDLVSEEEQGLQGYTNGQAISLGVTIIGRQIDISSAETLDVFLITTDLLGLRNNSSCITTTAYGYPCDWKYMDYFYLIALDSGLIEGDLNAELANFDLEMAYLFEISINSGEMYEIALSDGTIHEDASFGAIPLYAGFYGLSGT